MKTKVLLISLSFFILVGCERDEREKISEKFEELPRDIAESKPCPTLYKGIIGMFRESTRNHEVHPSLFLPSAEKSIRIKNDTEVYITFISEGAGWANSLGYYTYESDNPPGSSADIKKHILFPHVSDGILNQGDRLQVGTGKLKAGTVVGFFLIARGWEDGVVYYNRATMYTNNNLNKNQYQQHVLFREGVCGDIVLGFEDRALDVKDCDFDYNDVIMTIADNNQDRETINFDLSKVVVLTPE